MTNFFLQENRFKFLITYDGFDYAGWQIQPGKQTIQGLIEKAIAEVFKEKIHIHGSGRTDQGVHAVGQVAHADITTRMCTSSIQKALNARLPPAIRITAIQKVSSSFHARKSAVRKEYRYFIWNASALPPFLWRYRLHITKPLSIKAMQEAAWYLKGKHDFSAFSANPMRHVPCKVRALSMLSISRNGNEIIIRAQSDGFLYKMVRSLVGFLVRVGEGAEEPEAARGILSSKQRTARVPTAPPAGLFLWKVWYPKKQLVSSEQGDNRGEFDE
jgi:tRNA pseudouridine38-40 synthase